MVSYLIVLFLPTPPAPGVSAQGQGRPRDWERRSHPLGLGTVPFSVGSQSPPDSYLRGLFPSLVLDLTVSQGGGDQRPSAKPLCGVGTRNGVPALIEVLKGKVAPPLESLAWCLL